MHVEDHAVVDRDAEDDANHLEHALRLCAPTRELPSSPQSARLTADDASRQGQQPKPKRVASGRNLEGIRVEPERVSLLLIHEHAVPKGSSSPRLIVTRRSRYQRAAPPHEPGQSLGRLRSDSLGRPVGLRTSDRTSRARSAGRTPFARRPRRWPPRRRSGPVQSRRRCGPVPAQMWTKHCRAQRGRTAPRPTPVWVRIYHPLGQLDGYEDQRSRVAWTPPPRHACTCTGA